MKKFVVHLYDILNELEGIEKININDLYNRDKKEKYRKHLQLMSTELMRHDFGDDIWIKYLQKNISSPFVIDDIRFKSEFYAFKENSITIRILSDNEIYSDHVSEHEIDNEKTNYILYNNGSKEDLFKSIDLIMSN